MAAEEYGAVLEVSTTNAGTVFAADEATGQTVLSLADVTLFNELGGQVYIDGTTYYYESVDQVASTMTLLVGLVADAVADETQVEIYPPAPLRTALVAFGVEEGEAVRVTIPHFFSGMPDGVRPVHARETGLVEERNPGELYLKDVIAKGMIQLGPGEDLDNYISQGVFIQMYSADAVSGLNYPVPYAGMLEVLSTRPGDIMVQRYTAYRTASAANEASSWIRAFGVGVWSPWQPLNRGPYYAEATATAQNTFPVATVTDVVGATLSVPVGSTADVFWVDAVLEIQNITTAGGDLIGRLNVNGAEEVKQILWRSQDAAGTRRTKTGRWRVTGVAAGTRTFKLTVSGPIGVYQINIARTTISVEQV